MKTLISKRIVFLFAAVLFAATVFFARPVSVRAAEQGAAEAVVSEEAAGVTAEASIKTAKAYAAGIAMAIAAAAAAISMGLAISRSNESIARQPEAAGNIRTQLMLGLVFIETVAIYTMIIGILIVFVL